jgi:hypothetical protein
MRTNRLLRSAAVLLAMLILAAVFALARLWFRNWGATADEIARPLPGDVIVQRPHEQGTRAISIEAPAGRVWAWLAQTGQDRGGFHSYELLEDLAGARMTNLPYLDPALQNWKLGDRLWMTPPDRFGGAGHAVLMHLDPGRALGFGTRQIGTSPTAPVDASWTFVVEPTGPASARLLVRSRGTGGTALVATAVTVAAFEPMHFVMERRMMEVIKARAEGRPVSAARDNLQLALWTITFLAGLAAAVAVLFGRQPHRRLLVLLAAGLLFQLLAFTQPSPWLGAPLVLALLAAGWLPPLAGLPLRYRSSTASTVGS